MPHTVITGASGGIARALAARLAPGHELTLVTRQPALPQAPAGAIVVQADLSTEAGAAALAAALDARPPVTGAAHLAGSLLLRPAHRTSFAEWRAAMAANLDSAFLLLRTLAGRQPPMRGAIVFASSVAATVGLANHEAVAAAKAGIEGLVRAAAATYAGQGLRVNAIAPALTETPLTAAMVSAEAARKAVTALHPLGRLGTADEQAAAIAFLLSDEASWITGQVLGVDGGLGRVRSR